jgi:hypothetical protein
LSSGKKAAQEITYRFSLKYFHLDFHAESESGKDAILNHYACVKRQRPPEFRALRPKKICLMLEFIYVNLSPNVKAIDSSMVWTWAGAACGVGG